MNGRAIVMLLVAMICGLGAMYGTSKLLTRDKGKELETQDVVVAARDLKVEEVIKPDMVRIVRTPKSAVPAGAYTEVKDVEDRWVQVGVLENDALVDRKLAPRGSPPGLVSRIPDGMRAMALEVSEKTGVSGFILPDHHVDVVQTETNVGGQQDATTVLQDILVLASGQVFIRPDDRSMVVRTVTLAVTPQQVDTLVAAQAKGPLSLALRGLNDHTIVAVKKKPVEEKPVQVAMKEPEPPPPPPPAPLPPLPPPLPPARFVYIYRGLVVRDKVRLDQQEDSVTEPELTQTSVEPQTAPATPR